MRTPIGERGGVGKSRVWPRSPIIWFTVLTAVLTSAGCSGGDGEDSADDAPISERYVSFLLGVAPSSEWNKVNTDIEEQTEQAKGDCMRSRGFDYKNRPVSMRVVLGPELRSTDEEFVHRYGFGISTMSPGAGSDEKDPNTEAYSGLSGDAQDAWNDAESACETDAAVAVVKSLELDRANDLLKQIDAAVNADPSFLTAQAQ